jgi:hypothetical protein
VPRAGHPFNGAGHAVCHYSNAPTPGNIDVSLTANGLPGPPTWMLLISSPPRDCGANGDAPSGSPDPMESVVCTPCLRGPARRRSRRLVISSCPIRARLQTSALTGIWRIWMPRRSSQARSAD